MKSQHKLISNLLLIVLFGVIVTTYFWSNTLHIKDAKKSEFRDLAQMPELNFDGSTFVYPLNYQKFFIDNFPLRYRLISLANQIRYYVFQERFLSQVIIGDQDWLHLNWPMYTDICQRIGDSRLEPDQIVSNLERTKKILDDQGIYFSVAVIPDKCRIYPEYSQGQIPEIGQVDSTKELIEAITNNSDVPLIDLTDALLAAKENYQIYMKRDTHWTPFAAYFSYLQLYSSLAAQLPGTSPIQWDIEKNSILADKNPDLGRFSAIPEFADEAVLQPDMSFLEEEELETGEFVYHNPNPPNDLTLLVFHDSYFNILPSRPFLAEHVKTAIFKSTNQELIWDSSPEVLAAQIEEWQPDIILIVYVERNLPLLGQ